MAFILHMKIVYVSSFCNFADFFFLFFKKCSVITMALFNSYWRIACYSFNISPWITLTPVWAEAERPVVLISKVRYCRMGPNGAICRVLSPFVLFFVFLTHRCTTVKWKCCPSATFQPITIQCKSSLWITLTPVWAEAERPVVLISKVRYIL